MLCSRCGSSLEYVFVYCHTCGLEVPSKKERYLLNKIEKPVINTNEEIISHYSDKDQWYYIKYTQKHGPFSSDEMIDLYTKNEIFEGTFLWKRGMKEWTKLEDIPYLPKLILQPPPIPIDIGSKDLRIEKNDIINDIKEANSVPIDEIQIEKSDLVNEYPDGRPWIRYLGKMIDITIFTFVVG